MEKVIVACAIASCFSGGAWFARVQEQTYNLRYQEVLNSAELFYLVDEVGHPVSQESK